ncbi:hypothetical protein C9374_009878 [Naegleria lovaniensis]|uniref:Translation initiation factor eIF2B subunit beta n=1 Tax=Naegleria lovaniensis TaxID=51637 RepID=A0AA88GCX9_NAELO|nr:uncharacterized protein C9374_009878 [Naegleria lovaniensis]KAG2375255.1 hypothetical protein C9374_009878 [Naegleria lovaniensis]
MSLSSSVSSLSSGGSDKSSSTTIPSPLSKDYLNQICDTFIINLQRKKIKGIYNIGKHTAEILREIVAITKKNVLVQDIIDACRYVGKRLMDAQPTMLVIGNVVRRVLFIIRDEFNTYIKQKKPSSKTSPSIRQSTLNISNPAVSGNLLNLLEMKSDINYAEPIEGDYKATVIEAVNVLIDEMDGLYKDISEHASEHIHSNEVILTVGLSHTVEFFLLAAAIKGKEFDVIVTENAPSYSGHQMVLKLSKAGIKTTLISDASVFAIMDRVNKVVIGTHAVMANGGLVAPSGTHLVALAAKEKSIPCVVCNGLYKLTPLYPLDQDSFNDRHSPLEIIKLEDGGLLRDVHILNPAFDYVPPELIDLFITNVGTHSPSYIYRLLTEYYDRRDYNLD